MVIFTDISPFGPVDFQELATSNCEFQARMPGQSGEGSKHQTKVFRNHIGKRGESSPRPLFNRTQSKGSLKTLDLDGSSECE